MDQFGEVHWSKDMEAYVTPVSPNTVGIAVLVTEIDIKLAKADFFK